MNLHRTVMQSRRRRILAAAATLLLAACATPRYETRVQLVPPADAAGQACVAACEAQRITCQDACQARYHECAKALEPQVEAHYLDALKQYEIDLKRYATELRRYEIQLQFEWMHRHPFIHPWWWWDPWPGPHYPPPEPSPIMPTRESVRAQLEKTHCQDDCGCLPAYDACFIACGGQRVTETVCVKNCPRQ
jgi:hypothetical protein